MRDASERTEVAFRLVLFGVLTSFGYLLYGIFLTNVSPTFLTLNTFVWLFLIQCVKFDGSVVRFRLPLRAIQFALSVHLLGFALCQFAYWYLFWSGASMLKGGGDDNFAPLALGILALNTLATPVAMHYAKRDQLTGLSVAPFIALSFPLAISIVLLELDMTWKEFSSKLSFLDDLKTASIEISSPTAKVVICLLIAVIAEAIGDFLLTRSEILKTVTKKQFSKGMELAAFVDRETDAFIRSTPLEKLLEIVVRACSAKFRFADKEHESVLATLQELRGPKVDAATLREGELTLVPRRQTSEKVLDEAMGRLDQAEAYQTELSAAAQDRRKELQRLVARDYWQEIYAHVEESLDAEAEKRMTDDARESAVDLMAIIGILLSLVLVIVDVTRTTGPLTWPSLALVFILALLGVTGSSARPLCLLPLLKRHAEALIPPIYAVRPLIYFALGWLLLEVLGLGAWISTNVPLETKTDVLPKSMFTYWFGALLA